MKTGDKITITKPGKFHGLTGEVISNNELADKPLTIDLDPFGVWSFKDEDCEPIEGIKKPTVDFNYEVKVGKPDKIANQTKPIDKPQKRAYSKRGTPKEVKVKRSYNKKQKP